MTTPSIPRLAACPIFGYAAFAALVAVGCGSDPGAVGDRVPAGPAVTIVDSVLLDENDRFYLGNPFSLMVDTADGSFFISDFFENRILRYARDGKLRQFYGRPGDGPGEFRSISTALFPTRDLPNRTIAAVWRYPEATIDYVVPLPEPYQRSMEGLGRFTGRGVAFG
ncbi:MAG: hypothetical protein OXR82_10265 [Gammaproteobacteria bacterium]|nr:hypothetical protein [Gammaproteobacteria bacterium]MDE0258751.1 hypothetical protein [Gammaproteobacteria bacterium]